MGGIKDEDNEEILEENESAGEGEVERDAADFDGNKNDVLENFFCNEDIEFIHTDFDGILFK